MDKVAKSNEGFTASLLGHCLGAPLRGRVVGVDLESAVGPRVRDGAVVRRIPAKANDPPSHQLVASNQIRLRLPLCTYRVVVHSVSVAPFEQLVVVKLASVARLHVHLPSGAQV